MTALVVSHDPRSAAIADRVVHIRDGRVSEERRGEGGAVVIGSGGWLRIPEEALRDAGIVDRATVTARDGVVDFAPLGAQRESILMLPISTAPRAPSSGCAARRGGTDRISPSTRSRRRSFRPALGRDRSSRVGKVDAALSRRGSRRPGRWRGRRRRRRDLDALAGDARARFRRDTIAFIGQSPGLSGFLTARENVSGLAIRGVYGVEAHERAIDALVAIGLGEHADRLADLLSAGQRERVAVARALAARTPVILADEPTSRVDVAAALTLGGLFADIAHEHGTTFMCATHDPVLIRFADDEVQLRVGAPVPSA